jgi:hypothetical protein
MLQSDLRKSGRKIAADGIHDMASIERKRFAVKGGEPSLLEVKEPASVSVPYL